MFRQNRGPLPTGKELEDAEKEESTVQNWLPMWAPVILGWLIYTALLHIATSQ